MERRDFLKNTLMFSAGAGLFGLLSCNYPVEDTKENYSKPPKFSPELKKQIIIDGANQRLYLTQGKNEISLLKSYPVSTSKYGFGNSMNSNKTPTGLHEISFKIGYDAPIGTIFTNWRDTGRISRIIKSRKQGLENMTTRIMPLVGLEDKNKYTNLRGILIHGTSEEGLVGTPQSHGCIRMRNDDVIELFSAVKVGTPVMIYEKFNTKTLHNKFIY